MSIPAAFDCTCWKYVQAVQYVQGAKCTVWTRARYEGASGGACVDASGVLIGFALRSIWMFLIDSALLLTWMVLIRLGLRTPQ